VLGALGVLVVALAAVGIALAAGDHAPTPEAKSPTADRPGSATTTTAAGDRATTTPPSTAATTPSAGQPVSPTSTPSTTAAAVPTTTVPVGTPTTAAAPGATTTGCRLSVAHTGADTFTFTYTSDLGPGITVTFSGSGPGHALTDATGTAVFTLSPGYGPSTGPPELEHEGARSSCTAATVSFALPESPSG
jgi:hypothetical protein